MTDLKLPQQVVNESWRELIFAYNVDTTLNKEGHR